jgi:hypothetical protein
MLVQVIATFGVVAGGLMARNPPVSHEETSPER